MRAIIAGTRDIVDLNLVFRAVYDSGFFPITEVISGTARGIDTLGEQWATYYSIPIRRMPAEWAIFGKSAGYKRNEQMAKQADVLICIWDGKSKGTGHMIDIARKLKLKVYVLRTDDATKSGHLPPLQEENAHG